MTHEARQADDAVARTPARYCESPTRASTSSSLSHAPQTPAPAKEISREGAARAHVDGQRATASHAGESRGGAITADDLDNLRHMLGVTMKTPRGYRNHFVAGGKDVESMERLRACGFVFKNERVHAELTGGAPCYHATIEGAKAVGLRRLPE